MAVIKIRLLGAFDVRVDGNPIGQLRTRKEMWLLAMLAMRNGAPIARSVAAATLWPDCNEASALSYLRKTLYMLRRALGPAASSIQCEGSRTIRLEPRDVECDLLNFEAVASHNDPDSLRAACDLHGGSLLEGCHEDWVLERRYSVEAALTRCHETVAELAISSGKPAEAIPHLRRLVQLDPLRESGYRLLMSALAHTGDLAAMISVFRDLRVLLRREVNQDPDPETTELFNMLRERATHAGKTGNARAAAAAGAENPIDSAAHDASPQRQESAHHHSLPRALTSLVGRTHEIESAIRMLGAAPLVTLFGPGGVGKTRIAIETATRIAADERVWFAELSSASDADDIATTVAAAAEIKIQASSGIEGSVLAGLANNSGVLVLDNCEHLPEAIAAFTIRLLHQCPGIRVLATSRQTLGVPGEITLAVPTLELPPDGAAERHQADQHLAESLVKYDAIALFTQRARSAFLGFELNADNCKAVASICAQLDGLPMAIELAAARIRALTAHQISRRLCDRFGLLTGGSRNQPAQHQTLRALIDWSYNLLSPQEQRMLNRLSVFSGFSLEAAEEVTIDEPIAPPEAAGSGAINADLVLDLITALVEKSLVTFNPDTQRYRLLESIREYTAGKLNETPECRQIHAHHCRACSKLLTGLAERMGGSDVRACVRRCEEEYDNTRLALSWSIDEEATPGIALQICGSLSAYWVFRGYYAEGETWCAKALSRVAPDEVSEARARCASVRGTLLWLQGRLQEAMAGHEMALEIRRKLNNRRGVAACLERLGSIALAVGDSERTTGYLNSAIEEATEIGDFKLLAIASVNLGCHYLNVDEYDKAGHLFEAAGKATEQTGDLVTKALVSSNLAYLASMRRDYEGARAEYESAISTLRECGDRGGVAAVTMHLAVMLKDTGELDEARKLMMESFRMWSDLGHRENLISAIENLAYLDITASIEQPNTGKWLESATLLGACDRLREEMRVPLVASAIRERAGLMDVIRTAVGEARCDAAVASGRLLTLEHATQMAASGVRPVGTAIGPKSDHRMPL